MDSINRDGSPAPLRWRSEACGETMSIRDALRTAYNAAADEREASSLQPWKAAERERYLDLLKAEGAETLLEVGAGTGVMGRSFADNGLRVVATDLSPVMVEHCRAKGLEAYEMEFLNLKFDEPFDAVFGMNCLLHVPRSELPASLEAIASCLKPGGVAYLGQYGGIDREGPWDDDHYEPNATSPTQPTRRCRRLQRSSSRYSTSVQ